LELDLGADRLQRSRRQEQPRLADVGREPLDHDLDVVVAQLDAQHDRPWSRTAGIVRSHGFGRERPAGSIPLPARPRQTRRVTGVRKWGPRSQRRTGAARNATWARELELARAVLHSASWLRCGSMFVTRCA